MNSKKNVHSLHRFPFLDGLDYDLKQALLFQLKILWTYTSNSLEGNSLTLSEIQFILEEGLTIAGKSIKEHQEIVGHARAIDLIYDLIEKPILTTQDLFILHQAVQTEFIVDIYNPIGQWKKEINGRQISINQKLEFVEYPHPNDIEHLMRLWLELYNQFPTTKDIPLLITQYAALHLSFTSIHPFFDGNGRIARLVSNLPLLKAGFPPITISNEHRKKYIDLLKDYSLNTAQLNSKSVKIVEMDNKFFSAFVEFCKEEYRVIQDQIQQMFSIQHQRSQKRNM